MPFEINDQTNPQVHSPQTFARGLVPRDYSDPTQIPKRATPATDLTLIPRGQWYDIIEQKEANKAHIQNIRRTRGPNGGKIPSLDQDQVGYCWNHSVGMCMMLVRAIMNQPYARLSPFMVGCIIKSYQDEGGWGALALDFVAKNGMPTEEFWPAKSMKRSNDTPEMRANALQHRVTEDWADISASVYDRNLTEDQAMTLLLSDTPVVADFNWWGHSVCLMRAIMKANARQVVSDLGSLDFNNSKDLKKFLSVVGKQGLNSWTDGWGDEGEFDLYDMKAHMDGGVAPRSIIASAA